MKKYTVTLSTMTDGDRTVAEAVSYNYYAMEAVFGKGSSGREPGDKADAQIGEDLAVARALRSMAAHLERRANGRMRHLESIREHRRQIVAAKAAGDLARKRLELDSKRLSSSGAGGEAEMKSGRPLNTLEALAAALLSPIDPYAWYRKQEAGPAYAPNPTDDRHPSSLNRDGNGWPKAK